MNRRRRGHLLRWFLATMILVAGSGPPLRYGHSHAHDGEHVHHGGSGGHDHGPHDGDHDHDLPAPEDLSFHWHDGWPPVPPGTPTSAPDGTPALVTQGDSRLDAVLPTPLGRVGTGPHFPAWLSATIPISWLPPPGTPPTRPPSHADPPGTPPPTLVGTVLIRC